MSLDGNAGNGFHSLSPAFSQKVCLPEWCECVISEELMHLKTWLSVYEPGQWAKNGDMISGFSVSMPCKPDFKVDSLPD